MSGKLIVKHAFGLNNTNLKNAITFTEEHQLAYACGHQVTVVNTETKEQNFIHLGGNISQHYQSLGITAIAYSHPKKFIAVAEKADPVAVVTFYDSHTLRRKKTLSYQDLGSKEVRCIAFSDDGRFCLTQGAGPEWNLVLWNVEKTAKVIATVKVSEKEDMPVHQVSFCPWDSSSIIIIGKSIIRWFRFIEGQLRPSTLTVRRDHANFISHCWLSSDDHLVLGTEAGEIILIENFEFRAVIYPPSSSYSLGSGQHEEPVPVLCFVATSRGFVVGTMDGELRVFERTEEVKEHYQLEDTVRLPNFRGAHISSLCLGSDDSLVIATQTQQLYQISLSNLSQVGKPQPGKVELNGKEEIAGFDFLSTSFHGPNPLGEAAITGIDVALWRPIAVSSGKDKTVRIWNISDRKLEMMYEFEEEPTSISVHPSGLYIAVGFSEKIKIMSVLRNELFQIHELAVRNCSIVKFAHGGHFIAAATGSNIQVFDVYNGLLLSTLRGHTNKVRSISWQSYDSKLMSIGAEGCMYFWNLFPPGKRTEHFACMTPFMAGAAFSDGSRAFAATTEQTVKEVSFTRQIEQGIEGSIKEPRDVEMNRVVSQMLMDESRRILLIGTADENLPGAILAMSGVPQLGTVNETTTIHSGAITAMCMTYDNSTIISGDINGCICFSEFEGAPTQGKGPLKQREGLVSFDFVEEVVVHRADLESRKNAIRDLMSRVEELTLNNEHQLRLKEMEHIDKVKDITIKFTGQLSSEQGKFDALLQEKLEVEMNYKDRQTDQAAKQSAEIRAIDIKYKTKVNAESNRHKMLLAETEETHQRWNEENTALVESHQAYLQELTEDYEDKLRNEQTMQKKLQSEKEVMQVEHDQNLNLVESDADYEISEMKNKYQNRLKNEEETGLELMAQHALMKKNLQMLNKDADTQKEEIKRLKDKELRLLENIRSLEKDIQSHKKEIREREETITDKEKRIFDLKKKNQELEKFRFVLDYKIKELKLQIAPRENEIATMRRQIEEMDLELEQYHKSNLALNLMIGELKLKLDGLGRELASQEERIETNGRLMDKFKRDLKDLWESRAEVGPLKSKVVKLYRIYVQEDAGGGGSKDAEAEDPQQVYNRDREQMERSLDALRRALKTDALSQKRDTGKLMRESVILTNELNTLRKDARAMILQKKAVEKAGGIGPKSNLTELVDILGIPKKRPKTPPKNRAPTTIPGQGQGQTSGSAFDAPPEPPVQNKREEVSLTARFRHRSAAIRTTSANGEVRTADRMVSKSDQWEAWREIQMQNDQMQQLEDQLQTLCYSLNVDPVSILVDIDNQLAQLQLQPQPQQQQLF